MEEEEILNPFAKEIMPSCLAIAACLGLNELEPRSHPPFRNSGSSKGFR